MKTGRASQPVSAEDVASTATALNSDELRMLEHPALRCQLLSAIKNLIALLGINPSTTASMCEVCHGQYLASI